METFQFKGMIKPCTKCGIMKKLDSKNFPPERRNKGRLKLYSWCRDCKNMEKRKWIAIHKEYVKLKSKWYNWNLHKKAILKIGGRECIKCGTKDIRILTINHKNGDGSKETRGGRDAYYLWKDIITGKRNINDLEVRCFNCNILYEYEIGRKINWEEVNEPKVR